MARTKQTSRFSAAVLQLHEAARGDAGAVLERLDSLAAPLALLSHRLGFGIREERGVLLGPGDTVFHAACKGGNAGLVSELLASEALTSTRSGLTIARLCTAPPWAQTGSGPAADARRRRSQHPAPHLRRKRPGGLGQGLGSIRQLAPHAPASHHCRQGAAQSCFARSLCSLVNAVALCRRRSRPWPRPAARQHALRLPLP